MENVVVDVLLGLGVACELLCCVGVLVTRNAFDRLHYAGAGATVGPLLILAALLVREHLTSQGLEAIAAVAFLVLAAPLVQHALGRAARRIYHGSLAPTAAELERGEG